MTFVVMVEENMLPGYWIDDLNSDAPATKGDVEGVMWGVEVLKAKYETIERANRN